MSNHPAFEQEFEKALTEDIDGKYLQSLQRSLAEYGAAIERHIGTGLSAADFNLWKGLLAASEAASEVAEKLREDLLDA